MRAKIKLAASACAALSLGMTASAQHLTPPEEGRRLFLANNCYGCHGLRAGGGVFVGAPNLRGGEAELGDLTEVLREGGELGMPAFPSLNSTDINNLYAYFQSTGTPSEPTFNLWWEAVPTASVRRSWPHLYAAAGEKRLSDPLDTNLQSTQRLSREQLVAIMNFAPEKAVDGVAHIPSDLAHPEAVPDCGCTSNIHLTRPKLDKKRHQESLLPFWVNPAASQNIGDRAAGEFVSETR